MSPRMKETPARPTAIDGWLNRRLREHAPDPGDLEKVQERAGKLSGILEKDTEMGVLQSLVGGSLGKGTSNAPVKDLDLYLSLDAGVWGDADDPPNAKKLLDDFVERLRHALRWHYDRGILRVERQRHSVGVVYLAEGSANIDVVPMLAVPRQPGLCQIPRRSDGAYVQTSVLRQLALIDKLDGERRYLRDGIRLLKLWSGPREPRLRSYALEILAMHAVQTGCERSAAGVFWSVLDQLGDDALSTRVHVEGFIPASQQRFPGARHRCVIMDPAVVGNNVIYGLSGADADEIARQARYTMARLRKAAGAWEAGDRRETARQFEAAWSPPPGA